MCTPLPSYVSKQVVDSIPVSNDNWIGREASREVRRKITTDRRGIRRMGTTLIESLAPELPHIHSYEWDFNVIDENMVNAFGKHTYVLLL